MGKTLLWRIIKKYHRLVIAMAVISSLGIGISVGLSNSYDTLEKSLDDFIAEYSYADIIINTEPADIGSLRFLSNDERITGVDMRLTSRAILRLKDGSKYSMQIFAIDPESYVDYYCWDKSDDVQYSSVNIEYKFAAAHNISAGDVIELKTADRYRKFSAGSVVSYAENLAVAQDKYTPGENRDFGYLYIDKKELANTPYYRVKNLISLRVAPELYGQRREIMEDVVKQLDENGVKVRSSILYDDSPLAINVDSNLQSLKALYLLTPVMFFICMLIVIWLFLSQIIAGCRREIGILKALGFQNSEVCRLFSKMTLLITGAGSAVGIAISIALERYIATGFAEYFGLPRLTHCFGIAAAFSFAILTVIIGQAAAALCALKIGTVTPREAMAGSFVNVKKSSGKSMLLKKLHISDFKYSLISAARNKKRMLFSTVCIGASLALIFSGFAFGISKNYILDQICGTGMEYDMQLFFDEKPAPKLLKSLQDYGAYDLEVLTFADTDISYGGENYSAVLCGMPQESELMGIFDENGSRINTSDGIVLEKHLAQKAGIRVGDFVEVAGKSLQVDAISYNCVRRFQYISTATAEQLPVSQTYAVICHTDDCDKLAGYANQLNALNHLDITEKIRQSNVHTFKLYSVGVAILISFAVLLGLLIVFNTMRLDLYERKKELSVLRTLGFGIKRIACIQLYTNAIEFAAACIIGIAVGEKFSRYGLAAMETSIREYPFVTPPHLYILPCVIVLAYMLVSHIFAVREIKDWNIAENIKENT